jgi:spore germination cell wall hydrolase CwlJ-like protein
MMTAVACLAMAIYFEARGEPTLGQVAVGHVVMNRVHSERYPSDVCEVVKQAQTRNKKIIKHRCQFSFYCDGKPESAEDESAYLKSIGIAYKLLASDIGVWEDPDRYEDPTDGATFYHSDEVNPSWAPKKEHTRTIGKHIFYKEKYRTSMQFIDNKGNIWKLVPREGFTFEQQREMIYSLEGPPAPN